MEKAMRDAALPSLPCMAHTLQLVVSEGVLSQRSISDIISSGRRIVGHFKHSQLAYSRLHDIQKQLGQTTKRLQQDVPTRWNSSLYMLQSLLEQKLSLSAYAADYELPCSFTSNQWKLIENMTSLLAPFEELTQQISSSSATAADVIPSIKALTRLLEKTADSDHGVKTSKTTLLEAVRRRFADIGSENLYVVATIMDPRYKDRYFPDHLKPHLRDVLRDVVAALPGHSTEQPISLEACGSKSPQKKKSAASSLQAMFAELVDENEELRAEESPLTSQINLYLSEPLTPYSGQPLAYWQANKERFPALAEVARAYLCTPCTSVDSERLFSTAAHVVDEKRNRLTSKNAEMLIFIKKNLPFMLEN
ncbi:zinc finger BED domain-containing protein 4-like [Eleginops maclovinus]|uniref:zinc finger BED domain-containing protein 4-like n=1 Tax=Eleginops maclovinus TaxID=56733 RepID=UPI003080AE18